MSAAAPAKATDAEWEAALKPLFTQTAPSVREKAVHLLELACSNVIKTPNEAKFRSLNMEKLKPKLAGAKGALQFLVCAGWVANEAGNYTFSGADTSQLQTGIDKLHAKANEKEAARKAEMEAAEAKIAKMAADESKKAKADPGKGAAEKAEAARRLEYFKSLKKPPPPVTGPGVSNAPAAASSAAAAEPAEPAEP